MSEATRERRRIADALQHMPGCPGNYCWFDIAKMIREDRLPRHVEPKPGEVLGPSGLSDLLSLVSVVYSPRSISRWSIPMRRRAQRWAWATHLRASDNPVRVPKRPDFVKITLSDGSKV